MLAVIINYDSYHSDFWFQNCLLLLAIIYCEEGRPLCSETLSGNRPDTPSITIISRSIEHLSHFISILGVGAAQIEKEVPLAAIVHL